MEVLVCTRTTGYRHDSIPAGLAALREHGFTVSEDFGDLERYAVVVFLNTSGDILSPRERDELEAHVRGGGGFVGVHCAAHTEPSWPFYGSMIGATFAGHPELQPGSVLVEDPDHPATAHLPRPWHHVDEWYEFTANPRPAVSVLLRVDEDSYAGGGMGADHPIAWCHEGLGGRVFYTSLGHTIEAYADPAFRDHLLGGLTWASSGAPLH